MRRATVAIALGMFVPVSAAAGPNRGTFVQTDTLGIGVQLVFGAAYRIGRVSLTGAIEVQYNFLVHRTIGLTPLLGVAIRL